jgi:hypothetical protein
MSGVASTSAQGTATPGASVALSGQVITCGQGQFENQHGQVVFSGQGSVSVVYSFPLAGQQIDSASGSVSIGTGDNVTVHISGQEANFAQESVVPVGVLTGSESSSSAGTATPSTVLPLTGAAFSTGQGNVSASQGADDTYIASASGTAAGVHSIPLSGSAITSSQGTVTANDKQAPLDSGVLTRIVLSAGAAKPDRAILLTGSSITSAQYSIGAPGFAALTGASSTLEQGSFGMVQPLTGQEITSAQGTILGLPGLVALVGESATVQQGSMEPSGTQWIPEGQPTTTWTPPASPNSSWTRKDGPSTSWNRKT